MEEKKEYIIPECEVLIFGAVDTVDESGWGDINFPAQNDGDTL